MVFLTVVCSAMGLPPIDAVEDIVQRRRWYLHTSFNNVP
jgi:hypothetical protein